MILKTPVYDLKDFGDVYDPSEDSFLFLDALESEIDFLRSLKPLNVAEIGSGSGIIITAVATIFDNSCAFYATDINPEATKATSNTSFLNNTSVECLNMDLLRGFRNNAFDVIMFNPPYVVTESEEMTGSGINRAWAGGENGREITDEVLRNLQNWLTENGVCYMVILKENNIKDIKEIAGKFGFDCVVVKERKIVGEHLFVLKFFRLCSK